MIKNLLAIQNELKAPKGNYNSFGKYAYRSAEDILTAVKPLLEKYECQLTISDDIVAVGNRIYLKATAALSDVDGNIEIVTAFAREAETKKGMDESQITGTASSYARKYALNGLFLIDDTKDADTDAYHKQTHSEDQKKSRIEYERTGKERITAEEIEKLRIACDEKGDGWLAKALEACKCKKIESITKNQYRALMAQLGQVA